MEMFDGTRMRECAPACLGLMIAEAPSCVKIHPERAESRTLP